MTEDVAARMLRRLEGTPEQVASYLNGGQAEADMRALIAERDEARARCLMARAARRAVELQLARIERERDRLRAWVGYR